MRPYIYLNFVILLLGVICIFLNLLLIIRKVINPAKTNLIKDAQVFEVSKELYTAGSWDLLIHADKDYKVTIK